MQTGLGHYFSKETAYQIGWDSINFEVLCGSTSLFLIVIVLISKHLTQNLAPCQQLCHMGRSKYIC